jgi:hypothetical protein
MRCDALVLIQWPAEVETQALFTLACSGQLIPDTALSFPSATAGANPLLN